MLSAAENGMIGVPSGWEREAAWCWLEPDTYPQAIEMLRSVFAGERFGYDPNHYPTFPEDDIADYSEHPDNVPDVFIHRE